MACWYGYTVLGSAHFGDYAHFRPGPGNSMGYDDLKVIEARSSTWSRLPEGLGATRPMTPTMSPRSLRPRVARPRSGRGSRVPSVPAARRRLVR